MSFDDDIDQLKKDLLTDRMNPVERREAVAKLCETMKAKIATRRLEFRVESDDDEPGVAIRHTGTGEDIASVFMNEDGSLTFQSAVADAGEDVQSNEDFEAGYFPPYAEFDNEDDFMSEIVQILKLGLAEYELDQEAEKVQA